MPRPATANATPAPARSSAEIFPEIEQGTPEWFELRRGIPTASNFKMVMATSTTEQKTRTTYMHKLAGEILTGELAKNYKNETMERGNEWEAEVRDLYDFTRDKSEGELQRIGFAKNHAAGCSPDGLIGANGALEIKTAEPHVLIPMLLKTDMDWYPPEHRWQIVGPHWILEREWVDLRIYSRKMPVFARRIYRNEAEIRELRGGVSRFNDELAALVQHLRQL